MSALKEFADFITYNLASLAATYDRLLVDNDNNDDTLQTDSRMAFARRLIKCVAEACEAGTPEPLLTLVGQRATQHPHPRQLLLEIEYLGQTLTPVVTNLEAGKFLWQSLSEARNILWPGSSGLADVSPARPEQPKLLVEESKLEEYRQRQLAESLHEVALILNSSLDHETVLSKILEQMRRVVHYESGAIFLHEADDLVLVNGVGVDEAYLGYRIALSSTLVEAEVFTTKQPMVIDNVRLEPRWPVWDETDPIRAWIAAPLLIGEEAIGILTADSHNVGVYDEQDAQVLQTFANHVAVAIRNARLFAEQKRIAEELTFQIESNKLAQETQKRLTAILESTSDMVGSADTTGKVLYMNRAGRKMLGISEDEILDESQITDFSPAWANDIILGQGLPTAIQSGIWSGETALLHRDGREIPVSQVIIAHKSGDGAVEYLSTIVRDMTERKRAEQAMQESQQRLSSLVRQSPLAIIEWNMAFEVAAWNPAAERIFGYSREEALGRHAAGLIVPEAVRPIVDQVWQDLLAQKGGTRSTNDNFTKEGRLITCDWYNTPLIGADGQVIGVASLVDDITVRKQTEEALQRAETNYRTLIQNMPLGLYRNTPGPQGKFLMANSAIAQIFGYDSGDEFMQVKVADLYADPAKRQAFAEKLLAQGQVTREELQLKRRDGRPLWGAVTARVVYDETGEIVHFDGMIEDITEQKRAEEAVRESQRMLQLVMDNVPQSIFWKDKDLVYLGCNRRFAADAGLNSPQEIIGKRDTELVWREQAELYNVDDRRVMEANQPKINFEEPQTTPTGETIWLQTSKVPLHDSQGNVMGILGMYGDITDRKQAETALQKAREELELRVEERTAALAQANTSLQEQIAERQRVEAERERLLAETERRVRREQTIREITEKMRAATSLEQLVKITATELGERLVAGHAVVELGPEPETQRSTLDSKRPNNGR